MHHCFHIKLVLHLLFLFVMSDLVDVDVKNEKKPSNQIH